MNVVTDYIGGKHPVSKAAMTARRKAEIEAAIEQKRFRKVHPKGEVKVRLLAFIESPWVPTKLEANSWPFPRFHAGMIQLGMFWRVMGEGETAAEAVDNALKRYPSASVF